MSQMNKRPYVAAHTALFPIHCLLYEEVCNASKAKEWSQRSQCSAQPKGQDCCFAAMTFDIYPDPELYKTNATARGPRVHITRLHMCTVELDCTPQRWMPI